MHLNVSDLIVAALLVWITCNNPFSFFFQLVAMVVLNLAAMAVAHKAMVVTAVLRVMEVTVVGDLVVAQTITDLVAVVVATVAVEAVEMEDLVSAYKE